MTQQIPASKQFFYLICRPGYLEDDFERAANDSTNGGGMGGNFGGAPKQKEFIIKKMFKVPSNEQVSVQASQYPPSGASSVSQSGAFSAKGPAPGNTFSAALTDNAGINIYNVNGTANNSIIEQARSTQYNAVP